MSIIRSVGFNAINAHSDVVVVQTLLVKHGFKLRVDGICGRNTLSSIRRFQKGFMQSPDARVDVNGRTLKLLSDNKVTTAKNINRNVDHSDGVGYKYNASGLRLSQFGVNLLKNYESLRLKPYDDQTGKEISNYIKGATIGYGYLIRNASEFDGYRNGISATQAETLFRQVLVNYENAVKKFIKVNVTQSQFDALTILCYNIGMGNESKGFGGSTVVKVVNGESNADLDTAWKAWNKSQGKVSRGLIKRRETELKVYYKADYTR
jgi:GH24 family phage-related lysozyme (muramidase)